MTPQPSKGRDRLSCHSTCSCIVGIENLSQKVISRTSIQNKLVNFSSPAAQIHSIPILTSRSRDTILTVSVQYWKYRNTKTTHPVRDARPGACVRYSTLGNDMLDSLMIHQGGRSSGGAIE